MSDSEEKRVSPGSVALGDCYARASPDILRFFLKFSKKKAKNTTKRGNSPGLLHFFDIFYNSPGVTIVPI